MGNISSALTSDIEDFDSIVSVSERLNELANHVEDERLQSQLLVLASLPDLQVIPSPEAGRQDGDRGETLDHLTLKPVTSNQAAPTNCAAPPANDQDPPPLTELSSAAGSSAGSAHPFSPLVPGALAAVLRAVLPPSLTSRPRPRTQPAGPGPATVEQLRTELCDLREDMQLMKSQHNKEIKLLMNELDEEKKIRLSLQMEVQRMKKRMSK